jgi:Calcineurin-like phosphoesterase/RING-type zinc-finger
MSTHCPVCYEEFQAPPSHQEARILQCDHILCASCIKSDLSDGCFYCPECSAEHIGEVVDDVSRLYSGTTEEAAVSDCTDTESSGEGNLTHRSKDSDASGSATRPLSQRDPCQEVGCTNKSMSNAGGFCLVHSKSHRSAITAVDRMAKDMAETNLNLISLSGSRLLQNSVSKANTLMDSTPDELIERFKAQQRMSLGEAMELIDRAKDIMFREPNILQLDAPVVTVGDIHGQFYDLVNLLEEGGKPGPENVYLFLGDYVDRGSFSCEVMLTLLKLKVAYPDRIWLLRGNHECRTVSGHFGFKEECKIKYGVNVYYRFLLTFQTMPLAAVISTAYGDIFACHGGLSPLWKTLEDIQKINRFVEPEDDPALLDILWSDPIDE